MTQLQQRLIRFRKQIKPILKSLSLIKVWLGKGVKCKQWMSSVLGGWADDIEGTEWLSSVEVMMRKWPEDEGKKVET